MPDQPLDKNHWEHLTNLVAGLAHEIKNPLSTINLNLQLLKEDLGEWKTAKAQRACRKVEVLQGETERLKEILDDFLAYMRVRDLQLKPTDLNALVDEVLDFIGPEFAQRQIRISRFYDVNLPPVPVDSKFVKQALLNLLINAEQAIDGAGEVTIRTSRAGEQALIELTDTGCGMAPEALAKLFKLYFSTKKEGTGMGLPTVKRIVDVHGGELKIQSEQGKGTYVRIAVPISRQTGEPQG